MCGCILVTPRLSAVAGAAGPAAWRSSPPSERLCAIGPAAGGLNGRFFGHVALLLPLALRLAGALPLMASARRVPGAAFSEGIGGLCWRRPLIVADESP